MTARAVSSVLLVLGTLLLPRVAGADGMVMKGQTTGASVEVKATRQRAVLWLRPGSGPTDPLTWEIQIQPVFDRAKGNAAWVVPFAVKPEINEGSQAFLDQLNLVTSPAFLDYCEEPSCHCPGVHYDGGAAGTDGRLSGANTGVKIWEKGTVGALDYVILSTSTGQDLATWLQAEQYEVPGGLAALLVDYDTEGTFFFVSRLSADADPTLPMTTVRFVLPGIDPAAYPLRLTGLGVGDGEQLELTLWVLFPLPTTTDRSWWVPDSHAWAYGPSDDGAMTPSKLDAALSSTLDQADVDFVVTFARQVDQNSLMADMVCNETYYYFPHVCTSTADLGVTLPTSWCAELQEMQKNQVQVVRYEGRLSSTALAKDFTLRQVDLDKEPSEQQRYTNIYSNRVGLCDTKCPACPNDGSDDSDSDGCALGQSGPGAASGALVLLLVLLVGLAARRETS